MSIPVATRRELYDRVRLDRFTSKTGQEMKSIVDNFLVDFADAAKGTMSEATAETLMNDVRRSVDVEMGNLDGQYMNEDEKLQQVYTQVAIGYILPLFNQGQDLAFASGGRRRMTRRKRRGGDGKSQRKSALEMLSASAASDKKNEAFPSAEGVGKGFMSLVEARAARERAKELESLRAARPVSRPSSPTPEEGGRRKTRRRRMTRRR